MLPWPSKRHVGRPKRTFCSGSGAGTTPGLLRHDHVYGPRERDSSERRRRRLLRRLQVRFLTGFLPCFPPVSCKTVTSTLARSEDTACKRPSFGQRHHLLRQVWSCFLGACGCSLPTMQRISRRQNVAAAQIEVWAVSQQTLRRLDSRTSSEAHSGRGCYFGGAVGILRGWSGSNGHGAHHTQKATGGPSGSIERLLTTKTSRCSVFDQWRSNLWEACGLKDQLVVEAHPQGWWCSLSQDRLIWVPLFFVCPARPKRDFGVMCAVGIDGSSSSESEAEPYNIWITSERGGLRGTVMPLCL